MKTAIPSIKLLFYGFCLATVLYNCKTKDVDSLTPFTYTFKGLDAKLPDVKTTTPAAVSVTAATVTSSTAAAAVTAGVAGITASGQVPASVQQATTNVAKAVSPDKATAISAEFTPGVIATLTSTGKLPASLKAEVDAIATNPALQAYLPVFTLPTVNGKAVGGRVAAPVTIEVVHSIQDAGTDACKAAANAAFATAKAGLDAQRQTQSAPINAAYTQAVSTANGEVAGCQAPIPAKYSASIAAAQSTLGTALAALSSARSILGEERYALLVVLSYVSFSQIVGGYVTLQTAETNACSLTKDAKITNAQTARDADLSQITSNYNSAVSTLTTALAQAVASCHNQGNGG
ncbi:hypothetical protein [Spirosoma flavum]|uniref:Lipoprotein n=1 Tax=Spirosoma flavum TaxID=2048557 RepID=A0ABW6AK55_9BACT